MVRLTHPFDSIPGIIDPRREGVLRCQAIVHVDDHKSKLLAKQSRVQLFALNASETEPSAVEYYEQRVTTLDLLVWSVYPNGDLASIACWDLAIFGGQCCRVVGDGVCEVSLGLQESCSEGVDVAFESRWWWAVLEKLCTLSINSKDRKGRHFVPPRTRDQCLLVGNLPVCKPWFQKLERAVCFVDERMESRFVNAVL